MKTFSILTALTVVCVPFAVACSGDNNNNDGGTDGSPNDINTNDVVKTDSGNDAGDAGNAPPTLGAQIDRFGRPAVNTALNHVFDTDAGGALAAKDSYNADKSLATWGATYLAQFEKNVAIFDGLDTNCGNQFGFAGPASATSYAAVGGLLADDRMWLNTGSTTCTMFLAVEANALGVTNTDCGGRKLSYDVIDTTYSFLSGVGTPLNGFSGLGDGIGPVAAKTNGTTFPYLAAPQ